MKRYDCAQLSAEWMQLHVGRPTASEFDALVTPLFAVRTGQMPRSYLAKKVAESWLGGPLPGFSAFATDQGTILEPESVDWFEFEFGIKIDRVGFCTTDDGRVGCSPDGLIGEDSGIEIKCPEAHTHTRYLLQGGVPPEYLHQIHGCLYVTGRPEWRFLSYRRHFPPLLITVHRDEKIQAALHEALTLFLADFDSSMAYLQELNGGPPDRPKDNLGPLQFSWEQADDDVAH